MKVILIISDSFRRDHLGAYGNTWIHTPNLDRLAARACVFQDMYLTSFPTGPFRQDVLLGRPRNPGLPFNMWDALGPEDVTLPAVLGEKGIVSMLITDVANCVVRGGRNYYEGFTAWQVNRGQEGDPCDLDPAVPLELPDPPYMVRYGKQRWHQILTTRAGRKVETDWFAPGTFQMAIDWLMKNYRRDHFFLWVDVFDPHEPWDPPQYYVDLYDAGYRGKVYEAPVYSIRKKAGITDRQLKQIRARYAGECSMVDTWVGKLLAAVERLGIDDDTAVIFTSDHGLYLDYPGDGGLICKPTSVGPDGMRWFPGMGPPVQDTQFFPMRLSLANTPLLLRLPGQSRSKRIRGFAQGRDLPATIIDLFGLPGWGECQGQSLLPTAIGRRPLRRDHAFFGQRTTQAQLCNRRWLYAAWCGQRPCALYDLRRDPHATRNVAREHPVIVQRLHRALMADLRQAGADEKYIETMV